MHINELIAAYATSRANYVRATAAGAPIIVRTELMRKHADLQAQLIARLKVIGAHLDGAPAEVIEAWNGAK